MYRWPSYALLCVACRVGYFLGHFHFVDTIISMEFWHKAIAFRLKWIFYRLPRSYHGPSCWSEQRISDVPPAPNQSKFIPHPTELLQHTIP